MMVLEWLEVCDKGGSRGDGWIGGWSVRGNGWLDESVLEKTA